MLLSDEYLKCSSFSRSCEAVVKVLSPFMRGFLQLEFICELPPPIWEHIMHTFDVSGLAMLS